VYATERLSCGSGSAVAHFAYRVVMRETNVYRTASGMIFRVSEGGEGHLAVETLQEEAWIPAALGVIGLRVAPTTSRLTAKQVLRLPV
jgi:hypothetical protein